MAKPHAIQIIYLTYSVTAGKLCNMQFDLHVHTTISACSHLTVEEIISHAASKGLDGICITDHDSMAINRVLREGWLDNGPCVIFGMEYATAQGDFLVFGPFENLRPGMSGPELLRHVSAAEGAAVAAHPCRQGRSTSETVVRQGLCDIMETVNGRNSHAENQAAVSLGQRYGVKQIGGSDAHTLAELGRVKTRFHQPIHCRRDLIKALRAGSFTCDHRTLTPLVS